MDQIFNSALDKAGIKLRVDEIAFLNMDENAIPAANMIGTGVEKVFHTGGSYNALYAWFKDPNLAYRFEFLRLGGSGIGMEGVHDAIGSGILHGSFKLNDWNHYYSAIKRLDLEFIRVADFYAEYGCFAYFRIPGTKAFLKPRVNLRDKK